MSHRGETGFTTVELLITLFVAAAFIFSGYQLYSTIMKNAADSRNRSVASNIAYDNLRKISAQTSQPCVARSNAALSTSFEMPPNSNLPTPVAISGAIDCPFGTSDPMSRVTVTVTYDNPQESVTHAIYR